MHKNRHFSLAQLALGGAFSDTHQKAMAVLPASNVMIPF